MSSITVRVDDSKKDKILSLAKSMNVSLSFVINHYLDKFLQEQKIVLEPDDTTWEYYQEWDRARINKPIEEVHAFLKSLEEEDG